MSVRSSVRCLVIVSVVVLSFLAGPAVVMAQSPGPSEVHIPTIAELTPALLSAIVAAIISLLFRFVPALATWLDSKSPAGKQIFMLAITLLVAGFIGVWNFVRVGVSESSVLLLLLTIYTALTSNQTTYQFVKPHQPK
jgi:hypothetical protein